MTPLDRALIAWVKGNKRGAVDDYYFTGDSLFLYGAIIAARLRDLSGKPVLLIRDHAKFLLTDRHLRGRVPAVVTGDEMNRMTMRMRVIAHAQETAKRNWRKLEIQEMQSVGEALKNIRFFSDNHRLNLETTDISAEDDVVLGAKLLLKGKADALCSYTIMGFQKFRVFARIDDAILFKMKNDNVVLHSLE